jgi:hypothetical protein
MAVAMFAKTVDVWTMTPGIIVYVTRVILPAKTGRNVLVSTKL